MGIGEFIIDVICAPYSIPIGLINSKKTLSMCGKTTKKELKLEETTTMSKAYKGRVGTQTEDVSSNTDYSVLNLAIQDILRRNQNITTHNITANNTATINCDTVVPISIDPRATYDKKLKGFNRDGIPNTYEIKTNDDGTTIKLQSFGCCPILHQSTTISVSSWEEIKEEDIYDIYNEIDLNIENTLVEQGGEPVQGTQASVLSRLDIKSVLVQKIREVITNTTNQNISITQKLDYTDRYQRCEHHKDEEGLWYVQPKILKQSITIDVLAENIINSTNELIMKNKTKVDSKTKTVVYRVTNYRVIVVSLLCNVIICYAIIKLFMNFLKKMN